MKKLLTILLSVLMICTIAGTSVFAEDKQETTYVTYEVPATFEWSVPETLTVGDTTGGTISISNQVLGPGQYIGISVISVNEFEVYGGISGSFAYDLLINGEIIDYESDYIAYLDGELTDVTLTADWKDGTEAPTTPGTYGDTLTFTATVGESA